MSGNTCGRCGRPCPDGWVCAHCGVTRAGEQLAQIGDMTPAARDIAHGQARRGSTGAGGKPGSRLPLDLTATSKLDAVQNALTTWVRAICDQRGFDLADVLEGTNA